MVLEGGVPANITLYGYNDYYKNGLELYFTGGVIEVKYGKGVWIYCDGKIEKFEVINGDPYIEFIKYSVIK